MTLQETLASIAKSRLPLQGKLNALKFEFETKIAPPAAVEVLHRFINELIASGAQNWALKAGDAAPEFTLRTLTAIPYLPKCCSPRVRSSSLSIAASGVLIATST